MAHKVAKVPGELDYLRMFQSDAALGDWMWCLHCERAFRLGEYREVEGDRVRSGQFGDDCGAEVLQLCPYDDCGGSPIDWWTWAQIRSYHSDYPDVPERGKEYPLY